MVIDVWSWDANPGKAGEATSWLVKAAELFNSVGEATAKVIRPKNGRMMAVYFVTMAETQAVLDDCWAKHWANDSHKEMMKEHAELFNQDTSQRYQYREVSS